ncbi:MAG TPA: DUF4382 domain-containing protein [Chitinophagaceae bacterium]|jgi:hypothetical protein
MKQSKRLIAAGTLIIFLGMLYVSCKKENNSSIPGGQQRVSIRLSDNPVNFDAVNVDIQKIEIKILPDSCRRRNDTCAVWDTLAIKPGVYNLLDLANGNDTLLANGLTVSGNILKLRLTLGDNNSVTIDSVNYPLTLWKDSHTVDIAIRGEDVDMLNSNDLQLWLDFNAARSIVSIRENQFVLRPFLRVWVPSHTASIKGHVEPGEAGAVVAAVFNGDTLVAIPHRHDGYFKIRGITATSTDVFINATANNYKDTTITGVHLEIGKETELGTVHLHQ